MRPKSTLNRNSYTVVNHVAGLRAPPGGAVSLSNPRNGPVGTAPASGTLACSRPDDNLVRETSMRALAPDSCRNVHTDAGASSGCVLAIRQPAAARCGSGSRTDRARRRRGRPRAGRPVPARSRRRPLRSCWKTPSRSSAWRWTPYSAPLAIIAATASLSSDCRSQ